MRKIGPEATFSTSFDTLIVTGHETTGERLRLADKVTINGAARNRKDYPQVRGIYRNKTLTTASLASLGIRTRRCPYCRVRMTRFENVLRDKIEDELPAFSSQSSLEICDNCQHWEHFEFRSETYDVRALLFDKYVISATCSKTREFDTIAPEGSLGEIAQWFRRHPSLYNSVDPKYLELLVARIFADSGEYCEVLHVGRPDDGGVDVVLIESNDATWLVQVKRREHPKSVESVTTIRNLLGTLVLEGSTRGIVVSTADHFSFRAESAVKRAASSGFTIQLLDRAALDCILRRRMPDAPWTTVVASIETQRSRWFGSPESESTEYSSLGLNPNQLRLF